MEETTLHIGRKISRVREIEKKWKQDTLAQELGITQQAVSRIEQSETIEEATLERVAKALGVTPDFIKDYPEPVTYVQNNYNYEGSNQGAGNVGGNQNSVTINNPVERWLDALEEVKRLNEEIRKLNVALLKEKDEKIALLQQLLESKK